jgi:protein-tyrosine phosphatase
MQAAVPLHRVSARFGSVKLERGCLSLSIDKPSVSHDDILKMQCDHVPGDAAKFQFERDLGCFHCTLIHAGELQDAGVHTGMALEMMEKIHCDAAPVAQRVGAPVESAPLKISFDILGMGSNAGCWFAILSVPAGDAVRMRCTLSPKQFHITLGFHSRDNHSANKDCSVMKHWADQESLVHAAARMNICKPVSSKATHELTCILHHLETNSSCYQDTTAVRMRLTKALINSGRIVEAQAAICGIIDDASHVRDTDALLDALAVQHTTTVAYHLKPQREALADAFEYLNKYRTIVEGKTIKIDSNLRKLLQDLCEFVVSSPQEHRRRDLWQIAPNNVLRLVPLPLNFSLRGGSDLAGSGEPSINSIEGISAGGFKTVITLTEVDLPKEVKSAAPHINYKHFPINDRHAPPTLAGLLRITDAVQNADAPVLVHCLGGKGRTALVLAALMMIRHAETTGVPYSASESLAVIKDERSVIVTAEQVHMLSELYGHLTNQEWTRPTFPAPRIMCVGLPCSGKSTFTSQMIRAFGAKSVFTASQDELGCEECKRVWACNPRVGSVCVLDRCNVTVAERKQWLDLCHNSPTLCVYFNIDSSTCIRRSAGRSIHPTLPSSRAPRIIEELAGQLQAPVPSEGFSQIEEIRCEQDLRELMNRFGASDPQEQILFDDDIVPFPRTPHLINLGAATEDDDIIFKKPGKDSDAAVDQRLKQACAVGSQIVIEEKVDGANMGFRLMSNGTIAVQNRSHFVTRESGEQFKRLDLWLESHSAQLHTLLKSPRWILYGCVKLRAKRLFDLMQPLQGMDVFAAQRSV